jgi:hypothetical protein
MPEVVDIVFEVVFPEIAAHVPRNFESLPELQQIPAPRYDLAESKLV